MSYRSQRQHNKACQNKNCPTTLAWAPHTIFFIVINLQKWLTLPAFAVILCGKRAYTKPLALYVEENSRKLAKRNFDRVDLAYNWVEWVLDKKI